MKCDPKALF